MKFAYATLKQHTSRASRYALLVLIILLVALGGQLVSGSASSQDKFTMAEATTTEASGKQVKAKAGFELVAKDKSTMVARRVTKNTMSTDARSCICATSPPGGYSCSFGMEGNVAVCGTGTSSSCCKWVSVNK